MSVCDSEENRKKLAWLVPGYILLAWFFCVLFQPLGIHSPSSRYHSRLTKFGKDQVVYLSPLETDPHHCQKNGSIITLEEGQKSAVVIRLGRIQSYRDVFGCTLQIRKGASLDGMSAYIEELDLPEYHDDKRQPGGHWGSFVCHDYIKIWTGDKVDGHDNGENAEKLCGRWSAYDHEGHGTGALETVPTKAMIESCDDDSGCHSDIFIQIEMDGSMKDGHGSTYGLSLHQRKDFAIVVTGYKNLRPILEEEAKKSDSKDNRHNEHDEDMDDDGHEEYEYDKRGVRIRGRSTVVRSGNASFSCSKSEYQCSESPYDHRHGLAVAPRCIWSKLRCDYHQNCGLGHESDESGCGYFRRIGHAYAHDRLSPWSVSTMSLLIIVYLAIVLILVLVTMLLLRWHKVLRTPLEVLSEHRAHHHVPTTAVVEDTEAAAGGGLASHQPPPAASTVSIMVMYRPHKPRNSGLVPASVELPPSYDSLFIEDSPPSYNFVRPELEEEATNTNNTVSAADDETMTATASNVDEAAINAENTLGHCQCDCDHTKCHNAAENTTTTSSK